MDVFEPARLGALTLRNRVIKAATYEGMSPGGVASTALIDHHRRLAQESGHGDGRDAGSHGHVLQRDAAMPSPRLPGGQDGGGFRQGRGRAHRVTQNGRCRRTPLC